MAVDRIQRLVGQWVAERPDLDLDAMATVARLLAAARLVERRLTAHAEALGLSLAEGDILFTLRRAGSPYRRLPSQLSADLMVSSGTLTSRLDRLENRGFVRRVANPEDRRSTAVELTPAGFDLTDTAVTEHVADEVRMLAPLTVEERRRLDQTLTRLIETLGD
jgi:DNA-binding MarR family transcriptional regulator